MQSLHTQLFLTLIALPFALAWGLPLSWLSLFSTPLFLPFLICFLFVSSVLFFSEICGIPNAGVAAVLDYTTTVWMSILSSAPDWFLFGLVRPSWIGIIVIAAAPLFIVHLRCVHTLKKNICALIFLLCAILCFLYYARPSAVHTHVDASRGSFELIHDHGTTILIDNGILNTARPSWIQYTMVGDILTSTGSLHIDHLIIKRMTKTTHTNLAILCTCIPVYHVYKADDPCASLSAALPPQVHTIVEKTEFKTEQHTIAMNRAKKSYWYHDKKWHGLDVRVV
ncbi:MAG TPA: hypothetical protein VEK38_00315 [Candidatus Bathyarchaeia archaeon]|nr:hypothetical protein [Candidatus Bathyarchaeia archaeon]